MTYRRRETEGPAQMTPAITDTEPCMPSHTPRPFQLADALILIGGVAVAFALTRRYWDLYFAGNLFQTPTPGWSAGVIFNRVLSVVAEIVAQSVAVASVALLAIRLRGPGARRHRLGRQPGSVACAAVTLAILVSELEYVARVRWLGVENPFLSGFSYETLNVLMDGVSSSFLRNGYVVASAWLTLAMGRRWHPEPGWLDACGRAAGAFWVASIPVYAWINIVGRW